MNVIKARPGDFFPIGREGEHNARQVHFDISPWLGMYGDGVAELIYQRPGEENIYPVAVERQGHLVLWTITATDTAIPGRNGLAELRYYVDGSLVKSEISTIAVSDALGSPGETPEPPGQNWLEQALQAGADAQAGARDAEKSRLAAEAAEHYAREAQDAAALSERNAKNSEDAVAGLAEAIPAAVEAGVERIENTAAQETETAARSIQAEGSAQVERVALEGDAAKGQADRAATFAQTAEASATSAESSAQAAQAAADRASYHARNASTYASVSTENAQTSVNSSVAANKAANSAQESANIAAKSAQEAADAVNAALAQAKASGEFDGPQGPQGEKGEKGEPGKDGAPGADGKDYILTDADKNEIASMVEVSGGGGSVELDTTLTKSGQAADAEAVGNAISKLSADIADIKAGGVKVVAVEPADDDVPQVYLTGVDGVSAPTSKSEGEVNFKLHYVSKNEEFSAYCTLKLQGDSSSNAGYKKKNYTVKMFSDPAHNEKMKKEFRDWGFETNKYILKANWIDATHARQMVAYDIWSKIVKTREGYADSVEATLPNQGTSDGFPVIVYINDTYYGIYTWILPKSDKLFGVDEDDPNQFVIYGQLNTDGTYRKTANNFRALWSGTDVDNWEVEVGTNSSIVKTAVNNFANFVMTATDEEFYANLGNYCDVNSLIDGYLFDYYLCGIDALAQNMILICRDGKRFVLGVWDRDSTFGLWWNGSRILSTTYRCPEDYQERYSLLWARLEGTFYNELKARKAELRADGAPLSFGNIVGTFDTFVHNIGDDRYDENNSAYTQPSKTIATKKQFREFVRDRLAYVDSCVDSFGTVIKCADITLSESSVAINNECHTLNVILVPSATTQKIVWESSNTSIATVENGIITGVGNGSATITATCGQYSASCSVTVSDVAEPEEPEVTLSSISATYSGGDVAVGTALTALTGIVVTAHYSDGSSAAVMDYTLSGEIIEGSNTITVSYSDKTTTITVTGVTGQEEDIPSLTELTWTKDHTYDKNTGELKQSSGEWCSNKISLLDEVYNINTDGSYVAVFVWDYDGNYINTIENVRSSYSFAANSKYVYAFKVNAPNNSDASAFSVIPVDNSDSAVETMEINLATADWVEAGSKAIELAVPNITNVDTQIDSITSDLSLVLLFNSDSLSKTGEVLLKLFCYGGKGVLKTNDFGADIDAAVAYFTENNCKLIING